MPESKKIKFDVSKALKELVSEPIDRWLKSHGGDLHELAERCGVSSAYMAQVRRYGRIPGRPVLILLGFNLKIDGQKLFDAAGLREPYPYEPGLNLGQGADVDDSPFTVRFNMNRFTDQIRAVVRSELTHRSVGDLLGSRPLRIGVNYLMYWLFDSNEPPKDNKHSGVFPEFCRMLGVALQRDIELIYTPFSNYLEMLRSGQIDVFGPTMIVPNLPVPVGFSRPLYRLGVSAIYRLRDEPSLAKLPVPTDSAQLHDTRYQITVTRNSLPHLLTNTRLKRPDSTIIIGSSDDECVERVMMRGISRPAHIFVTNSVRAIHEAKKHPKDLKVLFNRRDSMLDLADVALIVRPDWPEVIPVINDAIQFLKSRGGLVEQIKGAFDGELAEVFDI